MLQAQRAGAVLPRIAAQVPGRNPPGIVPWTPQLERTLLSEDRSRIARELHDGAIQSLYGIGMVLHALRRERDPDRIRPQLTEVTASINLVIEDLRAYIHDLTPRSLAKRGLGPELCSLAEEFHARTGIVTAVRLQDGIDEIGADMGRDLLQITREALSNVAKHASASHVTLSLGSSHQNIKLQVIDDGSGMAHHSSRTGQGLANIRRRAASWRGTADLESVYGQGTVLRVTLPRGGRKL